MVSLGSQSSRSELPVSIFPSVRLSVIFPPYAPHPSPEASTSRRPPSHCRVHAGPCGDLWDARVEGGPCEAPCVGVHGYVWTEMKSGIRWVGAAGQQAASGPAQAPSGPWWGGVHGRQSWGRCDWAAGGAGDEGGGCLLGGAGVEAVDGGYVAVVVGEVAVGGWPGHEVEGGGAGCHPAWGSARKQGVHGGGHSPGCRSSRPLPWSPLLHPCPPSEAGGDDPGGICHGGLEGGQRGGGPGLEEAREKSAEGQERGGGPGAPQVLRAWPYGPQGSR